MLLRGLARDEHPAEQRSDRRRVYLSPPMDQCLAAVHDALKPSPPVPQPCGSRVEVMLKELGGMIWIQIASAIGLLRLIL
jgi:hypothetical protein